MGASPQPHRRTHPAGEPPYRERGKRKVNLAPRGILCAGRRIKPGDRWTRGREDVRRARCGDYFIQPQPDLAYGEAGRAADTSIVVTVSGQNCGRTQMNVDPCRDEARSSSRAHRSQGIADIEGEVVRHSARSTRTAIKRRGMPREVNTIMRYTCFESTLTCQRPTCCFFHKSFTSMPVTPCV